jgi:dTDP-4-dehydrorhamnose reductase
VDEAEANAEACLAANADGARRLTQACRARGLPVAGFSSDLVFDGRIERPYVESDAPAPLNVYGASKAQAEADLIAADGLMIRTAAFFSPYDRYNFAAHVLRTLAAGQTLEAAEDLVVSPTYVPDLVDAVLDLMIDGETGLRHLANEAVVSWAEFARRIATALDLDPGLVRGVEAASFGWAAARPSYAALGTERGRIMPDLDNAIARYAAVVREAQFAAEAQALVDGAPSLLVRPDVRAG